ncbi:MAG: outer membrane lipoprotein chaperone LolA, partial [Gammaproteobacteria bacterium]|nr:outer membrane lipoprotein chaperone LolA [Gammaproteobacteria bacterium]MCW8839624.1 outer membrane lipoprotein chaperone LolA [Gammaproteobacteria bacterium]MCW8928529.1 outer membrane lipoprotein chaperone LolA [Gammaproteobacteria bacterium]MCW8957640.1 outer membrane lipoprotein chaperone LolA [Gammaproteobacteria bacterium]
MCKLVRLSLILLLLGSTTAHAGEGQQRLDRFLQGLQTMQADFIQTLTNARGELMEESRGNLWISRPGKFRLHYTNPYEQLYVADGRNIWMYDRDLEQVTVKPQDDALGSTPALFLSSDAPLEENFTVEEEGAHEGFQWLLLKPRAADSNFDYVRLAMEGDVLRAMEMVDG